MSRASARLPRDVPEKAEAFLRMALCAASCELPPFVAMMTWLAAPASERLRFFRPITQRIVKIGALNFEATLRGQLIGLSRIYGEKLWDSELGS
jgi:hypothetical protein